MQLRRAAQLSKPLQQRTGAHFWKLRPACVSLPGASRCPLRWLQLEARLRLLLRLPTQRRKLQLQRHRLRVHNRAAAQAPMRCQTKHMLQRLRRRHRLSGGRRLQLLQPLATMRQLLSTTPMARGQRRQPARSRRLPQ